MPTGYTADLYDGKDVAFEDFVLQCARAFGTFIYQRDSDSNEAPKLLTYDPNNWNAQALRKAIARKNELKSMSDDDIDRAYLAYVKEKSRVTQEIIEKRAELRVRYEKMLRQVMNWDVADAKGKMVPNLKKFMIEQLTSSIQADARPYEPFSDRYESASEWYEQELVAALNDIQYHTERVEEHKKKVRQQNEEAMELYSLLGVTPPAEKVKA